MTPSQEPTGKAKSFTAFATNVAKIGGTIIGVHAGLQQTPDVRVIVLAALMVTGVNGLELLLDRLLGPGGK